MYLKENEGLNRQEVMKDLLRVELVAAEAQYAYPGKAAKVLLEFHNMLQAATTVVGVEDMAAAIHGYVRWHYTGGRTEKPTWYDALTPGDKFTA